jgi:hypothetical protein
VTLGPDLADQVRENQGVGSDTHFFLEFRARGAGDSSHRHQTKTQNYD